MRVYVRMCADEDDLRRVSDRYRVYEADAGKRRAWSATNPGNLAIRDELERAIWQVAGDRLAAADSILDIGCGTGWWLARLAAAPRVGAGLHGLELLPERVAAAAARVPGATVLSGTARALPYADGGFDVVTLLTVLSSLADRRQVAAALNEARRVLSDRGALLIWEPRLPNPSNRATLAISRSRLTGPLADMSLTIRSTTLAPPVARRLGRLTPTLYPALARVAPLRTHRLVCATVPTDHARPQPF